MPVFRVPATISFGGAGSPGANVWSIRTDEASVVTDELDAACTALKKFYDAITTLFAAGTSIKVGQDIVERDTLEDQSRPVKETLAAGSSAKMPPSLQVVVSWRTSLRARRGMGRTFIGPLASSVGDPADGTPASGPLATLSAAVQGLVDDSNTANGWSVGVWGLQNPGAYDDFGRLIPGQPHVHRDVTSFKVRDQFAILRSRRD